MQSGQLIDKSGISPQSSLNWDAVSRAVRPGHHHHLFCGHMRLPKQESIQPFHPER
jgi:hypothetical protein